MTLFYEAGYDAAESIANAKIQELEDLINKKAEAAKEAFTLISDKSICIECGESRQLAHKEYKNQKWISYAEIAKLKKEKSK